MDPRDPGVPPLSATLRHGLPALAFTLRVGIRVAGLLGELHRRDLLHGGVSTTTVLADDTGATVQLVDVNGTAGSDARGPSAPLALYMSPEQTGRIDRDVDYRADFYSLGVTLYELLTGAPPFMSDDALELVHAHIARTPLSPASVNPAVPEPIARVVLKLLAKAPADRYQSAAGLRHDLERCLREWMDRGDVPAFEPGREDVPDRLVIPRRLYGREREVAALLSAFEMTCGGTTALMLVSGYSGIGKTSLINELSRPILRQRGYFVSGKFDQVVRNIPFGAFTQALRSLVWQLLTEREERVAALREQLSAALGANGGVLAEVIPEVELILGRQAPPPRLEAAEARNRFLYVFQQFVAALARPEHPLVVFLDDLQWADPATLDLIHALLTDRDIRHLFIIGAFRDNEVDAGHLLTWAIERLTTAGTTVRRISLTPLSQPDLLLFLSDTLRDTPPALEPLAALILQKTDGNPFFVIQFLQALHQEGLLSFDYEARRWTHQLAAIAEAGVTDNVVDLMTRRIRRLTQGSQRVLTLAACIGSRFDRSTLITAGRLAPASAAAALDEAQEASLVRRIGDRPGDAAREAYGFLHDRVQQAAYDLIPDEQKRPVHLDVGRLLLADCGNDPPDERLFEIVNHLNIGRELIADPAERLTVARLNLAAGRKAKLSTAYRAAAAHFDDGLSLLQTAHWQSAYDLMFGLHLEAAECQYLAGAFDEAEAHFELLLERASTDIDRAQVHALRVVLYENQSRWADAVASGRAGLALFGLAFPTGEVEMQAALEHELAAVRAALGDTRIPSLADLPDMTDPAMLVIMRLLTAVWAPAYISGDHLLARHISATMVRLSLEHGHTVDSAYGYVTHAITVGPVLKDYRSAFEWGELALAVNERFGDLKRRAKIHQQFQAHVNLWRRPFETSIPHAREARRSGLESGDFTYAGYGAVTEAWAALPVTRSLPQFVREFSPTLALLEKIRMTDFHASLRVILNWMRALQGQTASPLSLSDATFDEDAFVRRYERTAPFFLTFFYAAKLHLSVLLGDAAQAVLAAERAREVAIAGTMWPVVVEFWGGLAAAAACAITSGEERERHVRRLITARDELAMLAEHCPDNFRCWALLLAAEVEQLEGPGVEAARVAAQALAFARQSGNVQHEALASEISGTIALRNGHTALANDFLSDARDCYKRWGASVKVENLERRYPHIAPGERPSPTPVEPPAARDRAASLDMATVLKAAHAIAAEVELEGLLRRLMTIALENAGAQRGMFVRERDGVLVVDADASTDPARVTVGPPTPIDLVDALATSVVRYVRRTGQNAVLGDASADERFAADPYIIRVRPKSVLCVPVDYQGRLAGILYLENNLTAHAFTPARLETMRILVAQTAISLENARLYEEMKREIVQRTATERALGAALTELEALKNRLEAENVYLQEEIRTQHNFNEIVGNSPALLEALRKVERVAPTESTVLITGETGCGKELFARAVHSRSRRSDRPLVKVNCGAIAPGLVESELFGHVKGAFTGAIDKRIGRFEVADGGTIFLDEVGELPLDAQVKLLRVLQEQEFEPVGSSRTVRVSVRVIAATNRALAEAVKAGTFRSDLLYRLNVFPIDVPPLRARGADIPLLVSFFTSRLSRKLGKPIQGFSSRSMERMLAYDWPGNVRELQNVVERAAILATGPVLELGGTLLAAAPVESDRLPATPHAVVARAGDSLEDVQRTHIRNVLKSTGGVIEGPRGAAVLLGLHPNTLRSRMKRLGIAGPSS